MSEENLGSACADMINATLKVFKCNLESTYDMSYVVVVDSAGMGHEVKGSGISRNRGFTWEEPDEELMLEHYDEFKRCKSEIKSILDRFSCRLDTTYDMSNVLIFDAEGNIESF